MNLLEKYKMSKSMNVPKRRRRENKTDYKARLIILKSGKTRIVIRKTNKYIIMQAIESNQSQDKVISGVTSKELVDNGWDKKFEGSLKSIPAAYLTGILMASKLDSKKEYILDIGMARNTKGRIFAAAKGLVDGGLKINFGKDAAPKQERINGEHLEESVKNMINKVKLKLEKK
jgi:large subunit ribosomal protein L18